MLCIFCDIFCIFWCSAVRSCLLCSTSLKLLLQVTLAAFLNIFRKTREFSISRNSFCNFYFCSSNFLRLSTSSKSMSSPHSSMPLSPLHGRPCPPWAPSPPFFSKASILAGSSLIFCRQFFGLSVFLSA